MSTHRSKNARRVDPLGRHPSLAVRLERRRRCIAAALAGGLVTLICAGLSLAYLIGKHQ